MTTEHNGPDAAYPGPAESNPGTGQAPGSGLDKAQSEPKQGAGEAWAQNRPEDWNPPPGNPGSDQDSQVQRDNGTARTDEEQQPDPTETGGEIPLPSDDDAPVEDDMNDVEANNSVSSEHPEPR